jgi:hypothetical protein
MNASMPYTQHVPHLDREVSQSVAPHAYVIPSAFIAAVIGSEKKIGSTRSTMSPETSRKLRLFSNGTSALRAPLSMATCKGSASERTDLMFP